MAKRQVMLFGTQYEGGYPDVVFAPSSDVTANAGLLGEKVLSLAIDAEARSRWPKKMPDWMVWMAQAMRGVPKRNRAASIMRDQAASYIAKVIFPYRQGQYVAAVEVNREDSSAAISFGRIGGGHNARIEGRVTPTTEKGAGANLTISPTHVSVLGGRPIDLAESTDTVVRDALDLLDEGASFMLNAMTYAREGSGVDFTTSLIAPSRFGQPRVATIHSESSGGTFMPWLPHPPAPTTSPF